MESSLKEHPASEEHPVPEEHPIPEEHPVSEEHSVLEEYSAPEEHPLSEEHPVLEEYSASEEHPIPEEHLVSEEHPVPEEHPTPPQPTNPLNVGFALVAAFAIGLALGFWGRPQIISDVPIQVVVTVVPENSNETLAQAPASDSQPLSDTNPAAPQQDEQPSAPAQPTPTIMDLVMADARHIQGDMDAPVTIVEFSDFK